MKTLFKVVLIVDQLMLIGLGFLVWKNPSDVHVMVVDIKEIVDREIASSAGLTMDQQQRNLRAHDFSKKIHASLLRLSHGQPIFIRQALVVGGDDVTSQVAAYVFNGH